MYEKNGIREEQMNFLKDLEKLLKKPLPFKKKIDRFIFGYEIDDNNNIIKLGLSSCGLTALPETIGNLISLKYLDLLSNKLTSLPESIGNLRELWFLHLENNKITSLPESIGNLTSLQTLILESNQLISLPESIGQLNNLKYLNLRYNHLTHLPETIGSLSSLKSLYLEHNQLSTLPENFWRCKNLDHLELWYNDWKGEWEGIGYFSIPTIMEFCRQKASITISIICSSSDETHYNIKSLKEFLDNCKEIQKVHINEIQLISNSHLLLFIATMNSIKEDKCIKKIQLTLTNEIPIIPIKGRDIIWEDLNQIAFESNYKLGSKLGLEFNNENVEHFYDELYEHIRKYKREVNLFESEERKIDKQWENVKMRVKQIVESDNFKEKFHINIEQFVNLSDALRREQISYFEFILKCAHILNS